METTESIIKTADHGSAMPDAAQVRLRPVGAADLPVLQVWDSDPVIAALMGRRFDVQTPQEWFAGLRSQRSCQAWVIELNGRAVGEVELAHINRRNRTAEIRICIGDKDCRGLGLGTRALIDCLTHAFDDLHLSTVYLRVFATNHRAVRLYERLGFRKEAVLAPSERRNDPAPVILMNLTRRRWIARGSATAV